MAGTRRREVDERAEIVWLFGGYRTVQYSSVKDPRHCNVLPFCLRISLHAGVHRGCGGNSMKMFIFKLKIGWPMVAVAVHVIARLNTLRNLVSSPSQI